jgi:hypothetical protein
VAFFGSIRIHLLDLPLERDEGEYAYAGQLIMHGIDPYRYCYSMKLPGTAGAYALFTAIFGQTTTGVHIGLLVVNTLSIVFLYLLTSRLFGRLAAVVASATFALLSLQPAVLGFAGHATQFVLMPAIGGILLLLKAIESDRIQFFFFSGVSLGLAFLMKQPGIFFILFGVFYLAYSEWISGLKFRRAGLHIGLLLLGSALPFGCVCLIYWWSGNFHRFWFWIYTYASQYGTILSFSRGWSNFRSEGAQVVAPGMALWIIALAGLVAVLWRPKETKHAVLVTGLLLFSFAAICPGLYFRDHYFVLLLPVVALLCGIAISRATALMQKSSLGFFAAVPVLVFIIALGVSITTDADFYFTTDKTSAFHKRYGVNPFPEAPKIADFIRSRASEGDEIAVLGSEPEIYFYSRLRSATGFVYMYPLLEPQPFATTMQHEMEKEVENASPRFVVSVIVASSWLRKADSDVGILTWSEKFVRDHYQLIGIVDLMGDDTEFHWDQDARNYKAQSPSKVLIFERT